MLGISPCLHKHTFCSSLCLILLVSVCQPRIENQTHKETRADRGIERVVTHFKISLFCFSIGRLVNVSIEDLSFVTAGFMLGLEPKQAGISL